MLRWIWILLVLVPMNGYAECLILKQGYVLPEIKKVASDRHNIYFNQNRQNEIWKLDTKYIDWVIDGQPGDTQEIQLPRFGNNLKVYRMMDFEPSEAAIADAAIDNVQIINAQEAQDVYSRSKKYPEFGVLLAVVIPSTGHFYAGRGGRGVCFLGGEALSLVGILAGLNNPYAENQLGFGLTSTFSALLVALRVWEIVDAGFMADDYNKNLKHNLHINVQSAANEIGVKVTYEF